MLKRISVVSIVLFVLFGSLFTSAFASSRNAPCSKIPEYVTEHYESVLSEYEVITGSLTYELMYDCKGSEKYVLCAGDTGYAVFELGSNRLMECGEGNPYSGHDNCIKYYGGPLAYYIKDTIDSPIYFNIIKEYYTNTPLTVSEHFDAEEKPSNQRTIESGYLANEYNYIRRRAFGYNDDGTCSAVACGIALNYLKRQHNLFTVTNLQASELLDQGWAKDKTYVTQHYPGSYILHYNLVNQYGMGPISYASGITTKLNNYLANMIPDASNRPTLSWTLLPNYNTIKSNINANKPVMITTTFDETFDFHTMVVLGYKTDSDNNKMLNLHTGWYMRSYFQQMPGADQEDKYYHKRVWFNKSMATYGYYFTLPNS